MPLEDAVTLPISQVTRTFSTERPSRSTVSSSASVQSDLMLCSYAQREKQGVHRFHLHTAFYNMARTLHCLVLSSLCGVLFAVLLGVAVGEYYLPTKASLVNTECPVVDCVVTEGRCGSKSHYTCWIATVTFRLPLDNATATYDTNFTDDSDAQQLCDTETEVSCWYSSKDPSGTLSIDDQKGMSGAVAMVVLFTLGLACCVASAVVSGVYFYCR